jgi:hypothetical protein
MSPPVDPDRVYVLLCNWTLFLSLLRFNLRNDDLLNVMFVFIKAIIATPYHRVPIQDLALDDIVLFVCSRIKSHQTANPPSGHNETQFHKDIRVIFITFYRL